MVKNKKLEIDISPLFIDAADLKKGKELLKRYTKDYQISTISDVNTLKELIFLEVMHNRLQDKLNVHFKEKDTTPISLMDTIHKNSEAIARLKDSLGIDKDKDKTSGLDVVESLKRRFKVWLEENQGSRTIVCSHCGKMLMLKIKTDAWETQHHPFFRDRILGNEHLIKLFKENKLTKEDLAKVFETSADYIDWLVEKWK